MPIIIEILIFFGVVGTVIWAGIKNTANAVSIGVKEKMKEREARLARENQASSTPFISRKTTSQPDIINSIVNEGDSDMAPANKERRVKPTGNNPDGLHVIPINKPNHHKLVMEGALTHTLTEIYTKEVITHFKQNPIQNSPMDTLNFMAMVAHVTRSLKTDEMKAALGRPYGIMSPDYERVIDKVCSGVISAFNNKQF